MSSKRPHTGDDGTTGTLGEERLRKNHPRIEALGTIDEASAALGLARSLTKNPQTVSLLKDIQRDLYAVMAEVAASPDHVDRFRTLDRIRLEWIEAQAEALEEKISIPKEFILPGDSVSGAALSVARTIVRRTERRIIDLSDKGEVTNKIILPYLNRLSLLCFLLELSENQLSGQQTSLAKK